MALTATERTNIVKLTVALYNAAPGASGLSDFTTFYEANGRDLNVLATNLTNNILFKSLYPNFLTVGDFATAILSNYGLQANTDAIAFITSRFNAGMNKGQIAYEAAIAINNTSAATGDFANARAILNNKTLVAENYSVALSGQSVNIGVLQGVIAGVTADPATVTAANNTNANSQGQTFTLTTAVDNLVGTSGNDVFVGVIDNFGAAATTTAGTRTTISLGDAVDGGAGVNTFNLTTNLTGGTTIPTFTAKNIQIMNVSNVAPLAADVVTVAASIAPQATQFNATSVGSLTVTGIATAAIGVVGVAANTGNIQTVTAAGANTVNIQGTTVSTTVAGSVLNIDVSGGTGTAAQAVVINSLGTTANNVSNVKIGNATVGASALTVNAAANLKTTITEFVGNTLKTVVISGAAATVDLGAVPSTALTSIDASGLTVGGAKVTVGTNVATTFKGGVGNDTLTIAVGVAMTGASDGGAGTNTLSISDALVGSGADTSLTAATAGKFTNFQTLQVASTSGVGIDTTFDASILAGVTSFNIGASAGGVIVSNLAANATVNLVGTAAGTSGTTFSFKVPSVTSIDTLNFNINNASTATTGNVSGLSDTKLTVGTSVSTLNIGSGGTILGTGTQNTITALNAADTGITKIVITGAAPLSLNVNALVKSFTVDGSAATGGLTINASTVDSAVTGAAFTNINGGFANDTIFGNTKFVGTQTIYGGGGGDIITLGVTHAANIVTSLVYKAGTDSLLDATGTSGASGAGTANTGKMDAVTNFISASDKIDITAFSTITAQKGVADKGTFTSLTAAITAATASTTFFNDATNTQRVATEFHIGVDTYVLVDVDHNGLFNAASDLGIKLTGTAAVVAADFLA